MLKKIVKFVVIGEGERPSRVVPENFFYKSRNLSDVIVIGCVTRGIPKVGDPVTLVSLIDGKNQTIQSHIARIEIQKTEVQEASVGTNIGILLPGVKVRALRKIRRTNRMKLYQHQ